MTATLLRRTVDLTRDCLAAAGRRGVDSVDRVLLVGGSSRMPAVAAALRARPRPRRPSCTTPIWPSSAARRSSARSWSSSAWSPTTWSPAGGWRAGAPLDDAGPDLDDACRRVADAFGLPLAQVRRAVQVRVDTVVSRGLRRARRLRPDLQIEATWLVQRNDPLPIRVHRSFGTVRDDQEAVSLTVVEQQGQSATPRPEDAKILIAGLIDDIPPGYPEGSEVRVTFEMGFDGVLRRDGPSRGRRPAADLERADAGDRSRRPRWPASATRSSAPAGVRSERWSSTRTTTASACSRRSRRAAGRRRPTRSSSTTSPLDDAERLSDAAVAERVAEVWAFWQRQRDHPKYGTLVAAAGRRARRGAARELLDTARARAGPREPGPRRPGEPGRVPLRPARRRRRRPRRRGTAASRATSWPVWSELGRGAGLTPTR